MIRKEEIIFYKMIGENERVFSVCCVLLRNVHFLKISHLASFTLTIH